MKNAKKIITALIFAAAIASFFMFDLGRYFRIDVLKAQQEAYAAFYAAHTLETIGLFSAVYILVTALSLPGATIMTLAGGALFGLGLGTCIVSFASSIGATCAFLVSRFLLRDFVKTRFTAQMRAIDAGVQKEGAYYLFTLRVLPIFPFFIINMLMGLTPITARTFYWVSQIGMLPGTLVYVNAGTQLGKINSLRGILSPHLFASFCLLGIFPLVTKRLLQVFQFGHRLRKFPKPKSFDYNLVVIGAGAAGLVSSYIAAAVKAKVALIEKHKMGGDCLNTGCVPSKALIRSAKVLAQSRRVEEFGLRGAPLTADFAKIMERVRRIIKEIAPHDSVERYTELGVECLEGTAKVTSPYTVALNGKTLTTKNIIIATGGSPTVPKIPGIDGAPFVTSETIWHMSTLPQRFVVLGGGPIGCELAQCFARFGSQVTIVEQLPHILGREDADVSALVRERFQKEGIDLRLSHTATSIEQSGGAFTLNCSSGEKTTQIPFDVLLVALGRRANVSGFGLEALGIHADHLGNIDADSMLRTRIPNIYVCGDVAGPYQFTHVAAHQAWYAAVNALFHPLVNYAVDYRVIPWVTYTDPEVARVGLSETEAKAKNIPYEVTTYGIDDLDRAIADDEAHGLVKVLTVPGKDKILGAAVVGAHAGDAFFEFVTAMKHGIGLNKILGTIHPYPTYTEANKYAAGVWKKAHAPARALALLAKFHRWRRT